MADRPMPARREDTLGAMGYPGDQDRPPQRGRQGAPQPGGLLRPQIPGGGRAGYHAGPGPSAQEPGQPAAPAGTSMVARPRPASRTPSGRPLPARTGDRGRRGPLRGFPPPPGQPNPVYPPGQFSAWNRPSTRAAWLGIARPGPSAEAEDEPDYSLLAVSDPSADLTSTQTWAAIDADHPSGGWSAPPPGLARNGHLTAGDSTSGGTPSRVSGDPRTASTGAYAALDSHRETAPGRSAPGRELATRPARDLAPAGPPRKGGSRPSQAGRRATRPGKAHNLMIAGLLLIPVLIVALIVAGYVYFHIKRSSSVVQAAPSNTAAAPSSPAAPPGKWGYILSRATDPVPLTTRELFPHHFSSGTTSGVKTVARAQTKCAREVIGKALTGAVGKAGCTQVLRASYLGSNRKMMATIGVLNLVSVKAAERAGRAAGAREFIRQLPAAHGPTHSLTKGTGLEEAEVKGHYLILIWAEFTDLRAPSGAKQRARLVAFSGALISGTVNQSLSSRMVTGHPQTR